MQMNKQHILTISLLLAIWVTMVTGGRKIKIKRKRAPTWRANSDPADNTTRSVKLVGGRMTFRCGVKANPKPTVVWYKNMGALMAEINPRIDERKYNLVIKDLRSDDTGVYTCRVGNGLGTLNWDHQLVVKNQYIIPRNVTVPLGGQAVFRCGFTAARNESIRWYKGTDLLRETKHSQTNVWRINPVRRRDEGIYTCLVTNTIEVKTMYAYLNIAPTTTTPTTTTTTPTTTTTTTTPTTTTTTPTTTTTTTPTTTTTTPTTTTTTPTTTTTTPTTTTPTTTTTTTPTTTTTTPTTTTPFYDSTFIITERRRHRNPCKKRRKSKKCRKYLRNRNKTPRPTPQIKVKLHGNNDVSNTDQEFNRQPTKKHRKETESISPKEDGREHTIYNIPGIHQNDKTPPPQPPFLLFNESSRINGPNEPKEVAGSWSPTISLWTIYVIVGSIAGGILLIGLVTIIVAVVCHRVDDGEYKSTTV